MDQQMEDKIRQIVADEMGCEIEDIRPTTSFDDINADSLDRIEIIMGLEEGFGIEFTDEECEKIVGVPSAIEMINSKKEEG